MVYKRTFKKPVNARGKLELMSTRHEGVMLDSRFSPQVTQNEEKKIKM